MPEELLKVTVSVPRDYLEKVMGSVQEQIEPVSTKYSRTFSYWPSKGTWKTEEGQHPFDGKIGEITVADEYVLVFVCKKSDRDAAYNAIRKVHPYEEPGIDFVTQYVY